MPRDLRDPVELEVAEALKGLDALDTPTVVVKPWWRRALAVGLPPLVALVLFIAVWQLIWASAITSEYKVPAPLSVWAEFAATVEDGRVWSILWTSISRAFIGFAIALVIATPLGLLVAKVRPVRAAIGPILSGLQSLPSVAWVPAAILWFGLTDATIYFVVLAGSIPSIANGLVAASTRSRRSCRGWGRCSGRAGSPARATSCCPPPCPATSRAASRAGRSPGAR